MVTTLYLIRHGETVNSEEKRYKGSIDEPLSERGIEQIKKTSDFISAILTKTSELPNFLTSALTAVYSSPLSRALKSAEIIAESNGLQPIVMPDLKERSFGIWEGMSFSEIKDKYPAAFEAWANDPVRYSPLEGESTLEVRERVIRVLNEIITSAKAQKRRSAEVNMEINNSLKNYCSTALPHYCSNLNIAVVAHGGVNRIILCHIMGIPLENIFRIEQNYAAVNIIEFWEKYPVVKLLNYNQGR